MAARIRLARPDDLAAVLELAPRLEEGVASWRDGAAVAAAVRGWVEDSLAASGGDASTCFVAEDEARVVGFISVAERAHWTGPKEAYIGELIVATDHEGQGLGRELVDEASRWGRGRDCERIVLDTGAANHRARRFYAALGFEEEDIRLSCPLGIDSG